MHKKRSNSNNLQHWENTNRDHQVEAKKECGNGSSSHCHKGDLCALFRWYKQKNSTSFEDILRTLRFATWQERIFEDPALDAPTRKILQPLVEWAKLAA